MTDRMNISADMLAVVTSEHGDNDSIGAEPMWTATGMSSDFAFTGSPEAVHTFTAKDETAAHHWVVNHLDISRLWAVEQKRDEWSVPAGNVAANVYNVTQGGGLEGLNLGWKGMDASTSFLCRIVSSVDEAWAEMQTQDEEGNIYGNVVHAWESLRDNGRDHEIADDAIPVATIAVLRAAIELQCTSVEKNHFDDLGYLTEEISMERIGAVALYELASSIVSSLMDALIAHDAKREDVDVPSN